MKIRSLVLEDDACLRKLIVTLLKEKGHESYAFPDPSVCPVYLKKDCPCPLDYACADIMITDIQMPNITGLKFIENQAKRFCKIPNKAMMSGGWTKLQEEEAKKLNCKIFRKPFDIDELLEWIDRCEKQINPKRKLLPWSKIKKIISGD